MESLDVIALALRPHAALIELVIAPMVLFIWLLRVRDREEVPHFPFADFAVLIAILDVALFIDPAALQGLGITWSGSAHGARAGILAVLAGDLGVAKLLVVRMEKVMMPIMLQEMDVGFGLPQKVPAVEVLTGRWNRNWWAYSWRLAVSWGMVALLIAIHGRLLLGPMWIGTRELVAGEALTAFWIAAAGATALGVLAISFILTGVGYVRFAPDAAHYTLRGQATGPPVL